MIAVPVATTARLLELRACDLLERAARWMACLEQAAGSGGAGVAARLGERWARVRDPLSALWPRLAADSGADLTTLAAALRDAACGMRSLERSLCKLPGQPPRAETSLLLAELAPDRTIPPVVLVPDDQDLDDDGFLALPAARVASPLAWPRLAFGLAAAGGGPASPGDFARWDREAAVMLGPAYLFSLVQRALPEGAPDLIDRVAAVSRELAARGALPAELVADLSAFGIADLASAPARPAALAAAERLAAGILASALPTTPHADIRAARERLLADPAATGPEAVYAALDGLREEPLALADILTGGWLQLARARAGWLREALASGQPWEHYGREVLRLDALILKSLETASVHRQLLGPAR